jgi:hypothetical protein
MKRVNENGLWRYELLGPHPRIVAYHGHHPVTFVFRPNKKTSRGIFLAKEWMSVVKLTRSFAEFVAFLKILLRNSATV